MRYRDELIASLAEALYPTSAYELPGACARLGLADGEVSEAMASNRTYVRCRLVRLQDDALIEVGDKVLEETDDAGLLEWLRLIEEEEDEQRISKITRTAVLRVLDGLDSLGGAQSLNKFSDGLWTADWIHHFTAARWDAPEPKPDSLLDKLTHRPGEYLEKTVGLGNASDAMFFDVLERACGPEARTGDEQLHLVKAINEHLIKDGFALVHTRDMSGFRVFEVQETVASVAGGKPKNLIFANLRRKPDLILTDALDNDLEDVGNPEDLLIYDRPFPSGLFTWDHLLDWWVDRPEAEADRSQAEKSLYRRLMESVKASSSPPERWFFRAYYGQFRKRLAADFPALFPQVVLHHDPRVRRLLVRQRMDFMLLLPRGRRVVLEIDGKHHYADNDRASPRRYAEMVKEDRRIRLRGYEVYRFGGAEFASEEATHELVGAFFEDLLAELLE